MARTSKHMSARIFIRFLQTALLLLGNTFYVWAQQNALLWEISGHDLQAPSYLFGTMHVKDKRAFVFHDSLFLKMKSCQTFAGELVIDQKFDKQLVQDILMPQGQSLKQLLSKSQYKKVKKYSRRHLGMMALLTDKIKPVFTSAYISESLLGSEMPYALDDYLQQEAKKYGLSVVGLETVQEQLQALDQLSLSDQALQLVQQIENIEEEKKELDYMTEMYAAQNLDVLYTLVAQSDQENLEWSKALIHSRNQHMAERLTALIQKQQVFCAIGAAHLPGPSGVLQLLQQQGYTLRPMYK
jgi:uncharacterized protein YbaP (TraB family)